MATDISVIVDPAEIVASVTLSTGAPGATGSQGIQGPAGADGADGSDASVTSSNIAAALGGAAVITTDSRLSDARTPTSHTHPLSDITQSSATSGQVPSWNGTAWVPTTPSAGGVTSVAGRTGAVTLATTDISGLATVATSGSYADLTNKPTIPSATTDASLLTSGTLADARLSSNIPKLDGAATQQFQNGFNVASGDIGNTVQTNVTAGSIRGYDSEAPQLMWQFDASGGYVAGNFQCGSLNGKTPAYLSVGNSFTAGQSITAAANTSALTASYSVTGANTTPLLDLSGTWNTTGVARGLKLNITDTASNAASLLADLGIGSRTQYAFTKSRQFWIYNSSPTTQDASNYERGFLRWNSNTLEIGTEAGGTGTARNLKIAGAAFTQIDCGSSGQVLISNNGGSKLAVTGTRVVIQNNTALDISSGSWIRISAFTTPTSSTATGTQGDLQFDANYIYVCTATNTWKRAALSTW